MQTWNPKSKSEPYAQSAIDLAKHSKEAVDNFFEIPTIITENLVNDIADGIENLFKEYATFVASCGKNEFNKPYFVQALVRQSYLIVIISSQGRSRTTCLHFLL